MPGVLLFGGSFNPLHNGHLIVARSAAEQLGVRRVVLIPGARPPHKQAWELAPVADRLEMCRRAVADDALFAVSDWETRQTGPNYTLHTVQHFRETEPANVCLYWLIGMDSLAELLTWHRLRDLVEGCTLVTAGRPGHQHPDLAPLADLLSEAQIAALAGHVLETPLIDIQATQIRARVRTGRSIRYLVPDAVRRYIAERGLYRNG